MSGSSCYFCFVGQILMRQVGNNSYDTLSIGFNDTSYTDTSILIGVAYNYRLWRRETCNASQFTIYSDTVIAQTVGINKEALAISKVYPIPANDFLFIETDQRVIGEPFRIVNISGQTVKQGTISSSKMKLNVQELSPGFYFFSVNESVKKFAVSK